MLTTNAVDIINKYSSRSATGGHNLLWDKALGSYVYDSSGRRYIDFSSGVLITNVGHSHPNIKKELINEINRGLLTSYLFPNQSKADLIAYLINYTPDILDGVLLFSTGSEAIEAAIRMSLARTRMSGDIKRKKIISFQNSFHGRTLGAQLVGGIASLKTWIPFCQDNIFYNAPFPDDVYSDDISFEGFLEYLKNNNIEASEIAAVVMEPFQGGNVIMAPKQYVKKLREWTKKNEILIVMDEIQSGFGRTGKFWAYEYFDIEPDIICCGKGISSSLPLSATITSKKLMEDFGDCTLSSTHSGNNLACAAGCANIRTLIDENLIENARKIGEVFENKISMIFEKNRDLFSFYSGIGAVYSLVVNKNYGSDLAFKIIEKALSKGVLFFNPVGKGNRTIKFCPPLCMDRKTVEVALSLVEESIEEVRS